MKITDLELTQYGIYNQGSWQPSSDKLNVVMGENESGKTTMLRFIRDMLFGYERGKWQGRKGNMGFVRSDGSVWRVYRDEKKHWFVDENGEKYEEEMPSVWWHGLSRSMYEQIFALGLEDLQGASFLSSDMVRSRFFMLRGGDKLTEAAGRVSGDMEKLLVASPQGKRKINQLLGNLRESSEELETLSGQEKDFSDLQKKQEELRSEVTALEKQLEEDKARDKSLEKRLGAWDYYKQAREIKRQLELSEQVKMFPTNGKEQWEHLVSRMNVLRKQREALQPRLDEYTPKTKEEVIPWAGLTDELESLYVDLGRWRQTIADEEELEEEKRAWAHDFVNMGYDLPLWGRALSADEPQTAVDWEEGRRISRMVSQCENELHFWQKREPDVETVSDGEDPEETIKTEEDWAEYEKNAGKLTDLVRRKGELENEIASVSAQEEKHYTFWFWLGIFFLLLAVGAIVLFYMSRTGYNGLYGAAAGAALALVCFFMNSRATRKKGNKLDKLNAGLAETERQIGAVRKDFPDNGPETTEDLPAFHNLLQERRAQFYAAQAKRQALSWKKETVRKQQAAHESWAEEGKGIRESKEKADKQWLAFLEENHLPAAEADSLSALQEQWQKIYSAEARGRIFDVRIEQVKEKIKGFEQRAEKIIRTTGSAWPVTPDGIAEIYEENRERSLQWRSISEKNNQHAAYQAEMDKLNEEWNSCRREMDALFSLVNAKDAEDFAEKVNAHEHHDQLVKDWDRVRRDIRLYAGGDDEFNRLWISLETGEYDDWMEKHRAMEKQIEEETARLGELQRQQGAVDNEIFRLAGDDTITRALQKKKEIEAEISSSMEEWLTALFTGEIMERARGRYESGRQPKIIAQADRFLQAMTDGKYSLSVSDDGKDVGITDAGHNVKAPSIWSSGTGDQVYLAIRLAMALSFGKQIEPLPIVLDDIFVRFDETRQRQTLRFLADLGRSQQIFLFTCHERTMKIAEEVGAEKNTGEFVKLHSGKIET